MLTTCVVLYVLGTIALGLWAARRVKTTADFAQGATSSSIERRYARTSAFRFPLGPDAVAELLFETFLSRPVEAEEQRNAAMMVFGSFIPGSAAGLLFHRHGANYDDLVDIVFTSEPYRNAVVDGAFQRYLGSLAPIDVVVPFAEALQECLGGLPIGPRALRDFPRLIALIKAVAVLRMSRRTLGEDGRLVSKRAVG